VVEKMVRLNMTGVIAPRLIGESALHCELIRSIELAARSNVEVLLQGPTGVGKELYARHLHVRGPRTAGPFVPVNCGAVPEALWENEMFGHVSGAFTGAVRQHRGLVEEACGGTLFLDEVDALPVSAQVKLLRLIQEKEYRLLGEGRIRKADVRIVAATNTDLWRAVEDRAFREDLYYRLRVVSLRVPTLKERAEDIEPLAWYFAQRCAAEMHAPMVRFGDEAMAAMRAHAWRGNVRELENLVRALTAMRTEGVVGVAHLASVSDIRAEARKDSRGMTSLDGASTSLDGFAARHHMSGSSKDSYKYPAEDAHVNLTRPSVVVPMRVAKRAAVDEFEQEYLSRVLARANGNISAAAREAGKNRRAFFELLRKHGMTDCGRGTGHDGQTPAHRVG
jgi:DNA-binding NtrC family response regulator